MDIKKYLGDLTGGSLMIAESHIIAETLLKKLPEDEWKRMIIDDNILQKKSVNSAVRNAHTLRKRLAPMGDDFLTSLLAMSERAYVQMLMLAFLIHSPIIADFMRQTLAEAKRTYKPALSVDAWADFIETRQRANAELANYSESTLKKMGNNVIKALVDSGYLNTSRQRTLQGVYLMPEVRSWLQKLNRDDLIEVMECTV
jgi:hypothetical protein